jgi:hypothetical protein
MSDLMRCQACGGAVVYDIKAEGAACMFCGATALAAAPEQEVIPIPDAMLPMEIDGDRADNQYRVWARSSWWHPTKLRHLEIRLRPMMLPAWRFHSRVESHYTGLVHAATQSGKRPTSGREETDVWHMVPASGGLSAGELLELQPFHEDRAVAWQPEQQHGPYEPPAVTERGARHEAHRTMAEYHRRAIARAHDLLLCKTSALIDDLDVKLHMVPIYIGAFRYRDRPWRFVINAQTGEVVGDAPIDRLKVFFVAISVLALLIALALYFGA